MQSYIYLYAYTQIYVCSCIISYWTEKLEEKLTLFWTALNKETKHTLTMKSPHPINVTKAVWELCMVYNVPSTLKHL